MKRSCSQERENGVKRRKTEETLQYQEQCDENVEMEEYVGGDSEEVEEVEETSCGLTEINNTVEVEYKSDSNTPSDGESKSSEQVEDSADKAKPNSEEIVETKIVEESFEIDNSPTTSPETNDEGSQVKPNSEEIVETEEIVEESIEIQNSPSTSPETNNEGNIESDVAEMKNNPTECISAVEGTETVKKSTPVWFKKCLLCNCFLCGPADVSSHENGKKHAKKLSKFPNFKGQVFQSRVLDGAFLLA